ncbi:MAG TPA: HAMP domain-containing protein [Candidatus Margulisiibacteriota bacterium]|nr:HAMP domain-containing protein [Candidatus Margulisiibacteriota bacterium]
MRLFGLMHHHPRHRARQLRWVVPTAALLLVATLAVLTVQYRVSDQVVATEFFRAHKTISHTGELLQRGMFIGAAVLVLLVVAIAIWGLRFTHRIVRPVHTMHQALDALAGGDLGVRIELHEGDEFHEVGNSLNRLVDEFAATLATVHTLVDRMAALTQVEAPARDPATASQLKDIVAELDRTMEFFRLTPRRTIRESDG